MIYRRKEGNSLPGFVVSIGNLTVGGTGKTPATCMLAEWALTEGYRAAILSRGYGGQYRTETLIVSDGKELLVEPPVAGDEPCLMARRLPGVPVVIAKKRYLAGLLARERFGTDFFILDDGFQHISLKRDLNLVLLDGGSPFGNGHLLPWGSLREPRDQLERADAFILTRSGQGRHIDDLRGLLQKEFPDKPFFASDHLPDRVIFPGRDENYEPEFLKGRRIGAFAGIARPESFKETLKGLGAEVLFFKAFRDHHPFMETEIKDLIEQKGRLGADYLLTTEKDWVRMEDIHVEDSEVGYLTIRFEILTDEEKFFDLIKSKMKKAF